MFPMVESPTLFRDKDGRKVVLVPLCGWTAPARLFPEDWDRLAMGGVSARWSATYRYGRIYVRCGPKRRHGYRIVAR